MNISDRFRLLMKAEEMQDQAEKSAPDCGCCHLDCHPTGFTLEIAGAGKFAYAIPGVRAEGECIAHRKHCLLSVWILGEYFQITYWPDRGDELADYLRRLAEAEQTSLGAVHAAALVHFVRRLAAEPTPAWAHVTSVAIIEPGMFGAVSRFGIDLLEAP